MSMPLFRHLRASFLGIVGVSLIVCASAAQAETVTETAQITADVAEIVEFTVTRDGGSAARGTESEILFDKRDSEDDPSGSPTTMYAPYRFAESGRNWHVLSITANGSEMILSATVSGSIGVAALNTRLYAWCGGFYSAGTSSPLPGTASTQWERLSGFGRTVALGSGGFSGVVPFNYMLDINGVSAGQFPQAGIVTFTLSVSP